MVSVYHLDGDDLRMTHYCAVGNQPRVKLDRVHSTPDHLIFVFDGGTNLDPQKDMHIHGVKITFHKDGKVDSAWERLTWRQVSRVPHIYPDPEVSSVTIPDHPDTAGDHLQKAIARPRHHFCVIYRQSDLARSDRSKTDCVASRQRSAGKPLGSLEPDASIATSPAPAGPAHRRSGRAGAIACWRC